MFIAPLLVFACLPGFVIPIAMLATINSKIKKEIEKLNPNISYEDFIALYNSEYWKELAVETISKKEHIATTNSQTALTAEKSAKCEICQNEYHNTDELSL